VSTYTYKLLGALIGVIAGIGLAITGALIDDEALKLAGTAMASAATTAIYTNGRKGTDQP
jgi:hypothetical protein